VKHIEGKMLSADLQTWLNEMYDTNGWNLVAVDRGQYIFERVSERMPNG